MWGPQMFGNNQIETLAKRVLRGEAEQSGRSSVPANDNAQVVCIDDRVSDFIDNPSCRLCRKARPLKLREFADSFRPLGGRVELMMGERRTDQAAQCYEFSLERCSGYPCA